MCKELTAESWEKIDSYFDTFREIYYLPNDYRPHSNITLARCDLYGVLANKRDKLNGAESMICAMLIDAFHEGRNYELKRISDAEFEE